MVRLTVTDAIKTEALQHSQKRMQFEYNRFGLNNDKRLSMILIGTIGQLMFKEHLQNEGISFEFEYQAGQYDMKDFQLGADIVEIKTSGYSDSFANLNLLYSADQFETGLRKGFKYCVQLFINGYNKATRLLDLAKCDACCIAGYIRFADIKNFAHKRQFLGDDYKVPINQLKDITQLISSYKK